MSRFTDDVKNLITRDYPSAPTGNALQMGACCAELADCMGALVAYAHKHHGPSGAEHVVKLMVERICATAAKVEAGSADRVREILLPRELN